MRRHSFAIAIASILTVSAAASAQDSFTFTAAALGGFSGTFDSPGDGFGHDAWQVNAGMVTSDRTLTVVRLGKLDVGDQAVAGVTGAELEYAMVAGEYRFRAAAWDTGLFVGIGRYRLSGRNVAGDSAKETAIGLALGYSGDFDVTRHLSLVGEIDFHYAFLDETQFFGAGLVGIAVHF